MIYRDEAASFNGVWNRTNHFTARRHVMAFADGGLPEAVDYIERNPRRWTSESSRGNPASQSWDLKAGFDGAKKLANEGWEAGVEALDDALHAIIPAAGREARWGWSQVGTSANVGRYLHGHPKSMRSKRKHTMGSAPVLHLVVNTNASCMVTGKQMANYGAAIVGLIDRLENTGKRVHLDLIYSLWENRETLLTVGWNVKRSSEHVDLAAVAFSIGHPAAFRRIGFAMIERSPVEIENYGYGYCTDLIRSSLPDANDATMLIDGVNHEPTRCNEPKDALRFAIEQLNKAAVLAGHATIDQPLINEEEALEFAY